MRIITSEMRRKLFENKNTESKTERKLVREGRAVEVRKALVEKAKIRFAKKLAMERLAKRQESRKSIKESVAARKLRIRRAMMERMATIRRKNATRRFESVKSEKVERPANHRFEALKAAIRRRKIEALKNTARPPRRFESVKDLPKIGERRVATRRFESLKAAIRRRKLEALKKTVRPSRRFGRK